jgi:glycosyltransferase involved in cell wall biosynthesis
VRLLTVGNLYPPHHLGGYELLWQAAVRHLRAAGHEVRVLTSDHREPGVEEADEPGVHRELRWYWRDHAFPRLGPFARLAIERHNAATWDRHLDDFAPDAVSWWAMGGMSLSLLRRSRLPGIAWVIDEWPVYGPKVDGWSRLLRRSLDGAGVARWVYCSDVTRRAALDARPGIDGVVEPLGVAPAFRLAPEEPFAQRLLYAGRIDERKGIGTAIEALGQLPGATLRIVGGGDPREAERLRALAAARGVAERVSFEAAVPRDRLGEVYAGSDVTVFPVTWAEPFGLVPLESMAVGRPVVATGRGGSADYLRDGDNALLFEAGDASALAAAVSRLADDRLRAALRAGGLRTAATLTEARWLSAVLREHEALAA